jgi:hypothetical protein
MGHGKIRVGKTAVTNYYIVPFPNATNVLPSLPGGEKDVVFRRGVGEIYWHYAITKLPLDVNVWTV